MITISKDMSNVIKGIAIIMMLVHHFWSPTLSPELSFEIRGGQIEAKMLDIASGFSKNCVAVFAFLTGYVLYINRDKYYKVMYILQKGISFLYEYWIIAFLFVLVGVFTNETLPSFRVFVLNLFGFEVGAKEIMGYDYVNVTFAWYVRFYLLLLASMPFILCMLDILDKIKYHVFVCLAACLLVTYFSRVCYQSDVYIVKKLIGVYFEWLPCTLAGYYTCRYNLYTYMKKVKLYSILTLIVLLFLVQYKWGYGCTFVYPYLITYSVIAIFDGMDDRNIMSFLANLGKLSMYIWFVHGIFFTPTRFFDGILYYFNNPLWSILLGGVMALLFSLIIRYLCVKSERLIRL